MGPSFSTILPLVSGKGSPALIMLGRPLLMYLSLMEARGNGFHRQAFLVRKACTCCTSRRTNGIHFHDDSFNSFVCLRLPTGWCFPSFSSILRSPWKKEKWRFLWSTNPSFFPGSLCFSAVSARFCSFTCVYILFWSKSKKIGRAARANTITLVASFADRAAEGGYDILAYISFNLDIDECPFLDALRPN